MKDNDIIEQFFRRDERAISQLDRCYGAQCRALCSRILKNREDAEECVNDSYYRLWDRIPPERPQSLWAFLSCVARNLAFDRLRESGSLKRGGGAVTVALDELTQLCGNSNVEADVEAKALGQALDQALRRLPEMQCAIFLRRYYYFEDRTEIAARFGISAAQVSVQLSRARKKLGELLKKEGYL